MRIDGERDDTVGGRTKCSKRERLSWVRIIQFRRMGRVQMGKNRYAEEEGQFLQLMDHLQKGRD